MSHHGLRLVGFFWGVFVGLFVGSLLFVCGGGRELDFLDVLSGLDFRYCP